MLSFELEYDQDCQRCRGFVGWILHQYRPIVRLVGKPRRGAAKEGGGRSHVTPTLRSNDGRVWCGESALRVALWSVPRGRRVARSTSACRVRLRELGVLPLPHTGRKLAPVARPAPRPAPSGTVEDGWDAFSLLGMIALIVVSVVGISRLPVLAAAITVGGVLLALLLLVTTVGDRKSRQGGLLHTIGMVGWVVLWMVGAICVLGIVIAMVVIMFLSAATLPVLAIALLVALACLLPFLIPDNEPVILRDDQLAEAP